MALPNGRRYADYDGPVTVRDRVIGVARALTRPRARRRLHPQDTGEGYVLNSEMGWWTVRPVTGAGSRRWISKPKYATRAIARDDREAALTWMGGLLGLY
ncbi:hypothetical protein OHB12_31595 [Nocardia sp. NBC_01730]|uniref:hypothetical protein n=1 Tax=Nocardia sp. NBC_01730 TaxID=2975998 RepID=UPI002E115F4A|nr:hypothetical protein OHB12_31595 [Nocardia sp. NBC_01730]